jgi:hypothetical protein
MCERKCLWIDVAEYVTPQRVDANASESDCGPVAYHYEAVQADVGTWLDDEVIAAMDSEFR